MNKIGRSDIVDKCICNIELVTDDMEKALAKMRLDQSGFDTLKEELGSSRDASFRMDETLKLNNEGQQSVINNKSKLILFVNIPSLKF